MKEDKRLKDWQNDPESILNTNSTKMQQQEEEEPKKPINWRPVLTVAIVVVALIGLIVGGVLISEAQYQKKERERTAKELRDGAEVRYFAEEDLPELKDGEVDYGLTALYYTKEDGMWLHFAVCNGTDDEITVERISVILNNSKKQEEIANGASSFGDVKVEERKIPAGEIKEFEIYFPPKFVKIKDDTLKEVTPTLTLEYKSEAAEK